MTQQQKEMKTMPSAKTVIPVVPSGDRNEPQAPFSMSLNETVRISSEKDLETVQRMTLSGIAKSLGTDLQKGICDQDLSRRKEVFGTNTYPEPPKKSFFELLWAALQDTMLIILIVAGTISLILGAIPETSEDPDTAWIEGVAILLAVSVVSIVGAANDYSKEQQFRSLNDVKNNRTVKVIRGGEEMQISIYEILVGELVVLDTGDQIPADGLYVEGYDLEADESVMTGESESVKKNADKPFMLSGCQVSSGIGNMLVICVGEQSEWGRTLAKLVDVAQETPLQAKLDDLAHRVGKLGVAVATFLFLVLTIRWIVDVTDDDHDWDDRDLIDLLDFLVIAVTIIVVAVPEGLPLAVTISLAYSMKKMMSDNNLVRHLAACETMGGATNICSDKTGTLTQNRMTVVQLWQGGTHHKTMPAKSEMNAEVVEFYNQGVSVNSNAHVNTLASGKIEYIGNKTEGALILQAKNWECDYKAMRAANKPEFLYSFSSARKRMSAVIRLPDGRRRIYVKGASEIVLGLCTSVLTRDGEAVDLTGRVREKMNQVIVEMASDALRTICLAYADLDDPNIDFSEPPEDDLTCIGIVGIQDPLRPEVPDAIRTCQEAGVFVRMVTGDNIVTAKAIAKNCGILTDGIAMEGPDFRKLQPHEMDDIIPQLQVLARSSPTDKFLLVSRLRHLGEVVGVTGDGTNDAPALKEADVGLAMNISGTEVAKEASDIIIMDDNFASIVKAIMWGRSVFDNIRKFLQFQLTVNVVALTLAFIGGIDQETPLTPVQLLWVNLIMDSMGALALGTEKPTPDLLERKPYGRREPLINALMWRNILGQAAYQLIVLLVLFFAGCDLVYDGDECKCGGHKEDEEIELCGSDLADDTGRTSEQYTMIFNTFVFMQIFNEVNSRSVVDTRSPFQGFFTNYMFHAILIITVACQIFIVHVGDTFTQTVDIGVTEWVISVLAGVVGLCYGRLISYIPPEKLGKLFSKPVPVDRGVQTDDIPGLEAIISTH